MENNLPVFRPIDFELAHLLKSGEKLTFLVGAGVSCDPPSNLASARDVMKGLIQYGCAHDSITEILQYPKLRYEYLVQEFRDTYDPDLLFMEYYGEYHTPNLNHLFLAQMVEQGHSVMTTNFDTLIERAIGLEDPKLRIIITKEDFEQLDNLDHNISNGLKSLYKIHGSVENAATGEDTRRSILTTLDAIGKHKEGDIFSVEVFKRPFFKKVCQDRILIVMGYSGGDDFDIVPMLLQIKGIKQIIWISHEMDPKSAFKSSQVLAKSTLSTKDAENYTSLDNLLVQLKVHADVDVIKLKAHTGSLLAKLTSRNPSINEHARPPSVKDWIMQKYPSPKKGFPEWFSAKILLNYGFYNESQIWFKKAYDIFASLDDVKGKARSLAGIGNGLISLGNPHEALENYLQASHLNQEIENMIDLAQNYYDIGQNLFSLGQTQEALAYFQNSFEINQKLDHKQGMAFSLTGLATIYSFEDLQKGADYYEEAYHLNEELGNLGEMAMNLSGIAGILLSAKQPDRAIEYYNQVIEIYQKLGELQGIMSTLSAMGTCFYGLGDGEKALNYYRKSNELAKKLGHLGIMGTNLLSMGTVYSNSGDFDAVLEYYQKAYNLYDSIDNFHGKANVLSMSAVIYFNLGDFAEAISCNKKAYEINDQLGNIDQMAMNMEYLGQFYFDTECFQEALDSFTKSKTLYEQLGHNSKIEVCEKYISQIQEKLSA